MEFQHVKPGKGSAFVRSKIKNLLTGNTNEKTFRAGEKVDTADIVRSKRQYTYKDGEDFCFMDMETYDESRLQEDEWAKYLKEGMQVEICEWNGKVIDVALPNTVRRREEMRTHVCATRTVQLTRVSHPVPRSHPNTG